MKPASKTLIYVPYAAPEVLQQQPFTEKTDVFRFVEHNDATLFPSVCFI